MSPFDLTIGAHTRKRYVDYTFRGFGNRAARRAARTRWAESFRARITEATRPSAESTLFERGQTLPAL